MIKQRLLVAVAFAALATALPARADVAETLRDHILPGYAAFAETSSVLADAAEADCSAGHLGPPFHAAYDSWMAVAHLRLGPVEDSGRELAISFWPDPKGLGRKHQFALLAGDPAALSVAMLADQSVAARGFPALERLLYPDEPLPADPCALIRATAGDLAHVAAEIEAEWSDAYADALLGAGTGGGGPYLSRAEVRQALFTQLVTGLEFVADQRLGRPMGDPDRPRPERAEARLSERSLRNVTLSLQAMRNMAAALAPAADHTREALDRAIGLAERLNDPVLAGVTQPDGRLKVEILQQAVRRARDQAISEIAAELGVGIGFNAADGD